MKRLIIYAYTNDSGFVGNASLYLLKEIKKVSDRLVIVCNAFLTPQGRRNLKSITDDVYCLNCKNIIQVAYADAILNYCGIETVQEYDEITFMDDSFWGPVCPLDNIYNMMEEKECDYWQMLDILPREKFIVFRNRIINDEKFVSYLKKLLDMHQRFFQNIGLNRKFIENKVEDNIYKDFVGESYIKIPSNILELDALDVQMYLIKEMHYPFWSKEILEPSYFDVVSKNLHYNMQMIMKELQDGYRYDFKMFEEERKMIQQNTSTFCLSPDKMDMLFGKIYVDHGTGYSEQNKFDGYNFINENGDFQIIFSINLQATIKGFRYDPIEKIPNLALRIYRCVCDGKEAHFKNNNGQNWGEEYQVFKTIDPYYEFDYHADNLGEIIIEGNMLFLNNYFTDNMNSYAITPYIATIFWDSGSGFSESAKIEKGLHISNDHEFEIWFGCDLNNVKKIRFDPLDGFKTRVCIYDLQVNGEKVSIESTNGKKTGKNQWEFRHFDPSIVFNLLDQNVSSICIRGKLEIL